MRKGNKFLAKSKETIVRFHQRFGDFRWSGSLEQNFFEKLMFN